jgi:hypothetical protein
MSLYYTYLELDTLLDDVLKMNPRSEEFMRIIMKVVCTFGKERILTENGIAEGRRLFNKIEPLDRNELMTCVFICTELSILEKFTDEDTEKLKTLFNYMSEKYSPDDSYLKEFAQEHLMELGFVRVNPHYIPDIQKHFMLLLNQFGYEDEF